MDTAGRKSRVTVLLSSCLFILQSCVGSFLGERPANSLYCDNFLVYDMCAQDVNHDGIVDFTYFEDSLEVFMFREGALDRISDNLKMHRCARAMDEDLITTTSRMFYIDDETSYIEKTDIRGALMIKYMAWIPEVTACNLRADQEADGS
jgi:hypothetical protein